MLRICRSQRLDMGLKRVMWVRRYQGQCRALRPLGDQGYRLRSYNKDQPLCSGYTPKVSPSLSRCIAWTRVESRSSKGMEVRTPSTTLSILPNPGFPIGVLRPRGT